MALQLAKHRELQLISSLAFLPGIPFSLRVVVAYMFFFLMYFWGKKSSSFESDYLFLRKDTLLKFLTKWNFL